MTIEPPQTRPGFVLLGMKAHFSYRVAEALCEQSCLPQLMIEFDPGESRVLDTLDEISLQVNVRKSDFEQVGKRHGVRVIHSNTQQLPGVLEPLSFDYLLTACWPDLIPDCVTSLAKAVSLNLHPSLLPRYPGPTPIQDQLDAEDINFGITLHSLSPQFDQGEIISQGEISIKNDLNVQAIEVECSTRGVELFCQLLNGKDK